MSLKMCVLLLLFLPVLTFAQYEFKSEKEISCTAVKNQDRTGTCWSFSTISLLESELMRQGKTEIDLSEMYIVRTIYMDKAQNYLLRQGKANFSQGSLSHDVLRAVELNGIVPEAAFSGKNGAKSYDHSQLERELKSLLDEAIKNKAVRTSWRTQANEILDQHLGKVPSEFKYQNKTYQAKEFAEKLGIDADDYVSFTSYSHHPFYSEFILEIPDNYSNGSYYNLPIAELQKVVNHALRNGYTVAWDGDVSEKGFNSRQGIAILPADEKRSNIFSSPGKEMEVTQALRQSTFEDYSTTDDHLMHFTGLATDQNGTLYYLTKNSWGEVSPYKGFLYMSSAYFKLKTVAITVHKDTIPKLLAEKLDL